MKVLLASTSNESFSGAAKCLIDLAKRLKEKNHDVFITIPKPGGDIYEILHSLNISVVIMREYQCWYIDLSSKESSLSQLLKRILNCLTVLRCRAYIRKNKFDVVHVNALTAYVVGLAAEKEKVPVVWHIREFMEEDLGISFYDQEFSKSILNKSSQIIGISDSICSKWKRCLNAPIVRIYDGVDPNNYFTQEKESHEGINVILYGRVAEGKGQAFYIEGAIKAADRLKAKCHFYIAGRIEDEAYFKKCTHMIETAKLDQYISYIGEIADVKDMLKDKDVVCVCSKNEGFGRVTVESQMAGCIVLGANTGATSEIIKNGINGFLYENNNLDDFADKLCYIVDNLNSAEKVAMVGQKEAIAKYSIDTNVENIISVYKRLNDER